MDSYSEANHYLIVIELALNNPWNDCFWHFYKKVLSMAKYICILTIIIIRIKLLIAVNHAITLYLVDIDPSCDQRGSSNRIPALKT